MDYFLIRNTKLNIGDLYQRNGEYEYSAGWNLKAVMAFVLGVLPCLPGYLVVSGVIAKESVSGFWVDLFGFGWFFSLFVAGLFYFLTAKKK